MISFWAITANLNNPGTLNLVKKKIDLNIFITWNNWWHYAYTPHEKSMPNLTTLLVVLRKYVINNLSNMIKLILNKRIAWLDPERGCRGVRTPLIFAQHPIQNLSTPSTFP